MGQLWWRDPRDLPLRLGEARQKWRKHGELTKTKGGCTFIGDNFYGATLRPAALRECAVKRGVAGAVDVAGVGRACCMPWINKIGVERGC